MPRLKRLPTGIRREQGGFRAYVRVDSELRTHRFPADTDSAAMELWRKRQRAKAVLLPMPKRGQKGSLRADADTYLAIVHGMPTFKTRKTQIELWVEALGAKADRTLVTPDQIAGWLDWWQKDRHWSNITRNHHRHALAHLYTKLDTRGAPNPARAVPKLREPGARPRGVDYQIVQALLDAMPGREIAKAGKGQRRFAPSRAKACLMVLAYVGMPPAQQRLLTPDHLAHLDQGWIEMPGRQKGRGTLARRRAVIPQGVAALKEFIAIEAWGGVAQETLGLVFQRAVAVVRKQHPDWHIPSDIVPYDLRHSFAEMVFRKTRSTTITAGLLGHLDERTTRRYIGGAVDEVELAAAVDVGEAIQSRVAAN